MAAEIVAADIGGTHARFAIAEVADGKARSLGPAVTLRTADHASLPSAWRTFGAGLGRPLPRAAGIAVAGPVTGSVLKLTNNPWVIRPETPRRGTRRRPLGDRQRPRGGRACGGASGAGRSRASVRAG